MYQTVILLLVTAVITIITTIVTVRVTMTGRALSQNAKDRFKARARKYGMVVFQFIGIVWNMFWLIYNVRAEGPITRYTILGISVWVGLAFGSVGIMFASLLEGIATRRRRRELETLEKTMSDTLSSLRK